MEPQTLDLSKLQAKTTNSEKIPFGANTTNIFAQRNGDYLEEHNFYFAYFNVIPNRISESSIDCRKANLWFAEFNKAEIKDVYFKKRYFAKSTKAEYDDIFYILYEDLIVNFDTGCEVVRFLFRNTDYSKVENLITQIKRFKKRVIKKRSLSLLVYTKTGIETKSFTISKPKLDIEYNYNEDFKEIHQTILKRLSKKNDKGLVLLHGKPGTGKTSYIRYLISAIKKDVIFLPPNMASAITNPDLISVLIDNPNSVFVIEDAENIVVDREREGCSPVSPLLNISDGLLSDCLNIQVICSFNTDITKVDTALLRKGRLIAKYEFKELELPKAQALSLKLGFSSQLSSPMTLTAIYNQEEKDFLIKEKRNAIGFKAAV